MNLKIRSRLSIQFALIVFSILLFFSVFIYFFQADYRSVEFYSRLKIRAENTAKLLLDVQEVDHELLTIIEKNNVSGLVDEQLLIFNPEDEQIFQASARKLNITKAQLKEVRLKNEIQFADSIHEVIGTSFKTKEGLYVVVVSAYDKFGKSKLRNLQILLISGLFISAILTLLSGWIYSGRALKPISKIINETDDISINNIHKRLDEGNKQDEIAQLAITFNRMLDRLEEAFEVQRSFVSNASHELRTPLTAITGQIEVSLMKERDLESYKNILVSILEDIKNLNKLSNGLLDLAAASSHLNKNQIKDCRVDDLLWKARTDLMKRYPNYNINIIFEQDFEDEGKLNILGNEHLLKTAIGNIMDNACKFSEDHTVNVSLGLFNNGLEIHFIDNGIGISKENLHNIYEPFFRGDNGKSIPGHGLGLSLTKKIIDLHNGSFTINSELNKGTTVSLRFPQSNN